MAIPDQFIDELSSRLNIVDVVSAYVPLTKEDVVNIYRSVF